MTPDTNIVVVGTGAVGSYYAGRLALAGARVSTLCRSDYDIVKKNGITVRSVSGDFHFMPADVMKTIDEYVPVPDYIIVSTKVLPGINIPAIIGGIVHPGSAIVLLQNGIDIEAPIASAFPGNEIISAIAFISVSRPSPGLIDHKDYGSLVIGNYPSGASEKTERLSQLFINAGVPCTVEGDIITARWKKLMWNAPFNPISVLSNGANTREMMESEDIVNLVRAVMEEIMVLAEKTGHCIDPSLSNAILKNTEAMAPSKTSMLQDYEAQRPLEVEAILGNCVRIARRLDLPVPRIDTLYRLLTVVDFRNRNRNI